MKAIVAADVNWGIGRGGTLLAHIPEDLKYFRAMTEGKTVIMGRKTYESLPGGRALKNRRNIVLTSDPDFRTDQVVVCHSPDQVLSQVTNSDPGDIFVIGGGQIYEQFLPWCTDIYVTKLRKDLNPDTYFPNLDKHSDWMMASAGEEKIYGGIPFQYCTYVRKQEHQTSM